MTLSARRTVASITVVILGAAAASTACFESREGRSDDRVAGASVDELAELRRLVDAEDDLIAWEQLVARLELLSVEAGPRVVMNDEVDPVDAELRRILHVFEADAHSIPPAFLQRVRHYVDEWFERPMLLRRVWERRQRYWPEIERAFAEEHVPVELAYVAWVESHFDPAACSIVGARGLWQFMPHTARRFGLRVDSAFDGCASCDCGEHDDRLNPSLSTRAAARYLGGLLAEFGSDSFMLALAAYNRGEDQLRRTLRSRKLRTRRERDFWHLYERGLLPEETREYVPRVLAAAIVGSRSEKGALTAHDDLASSARPDPNE